MTLKEKLKQNKLSIGSWVTINHPSVVEILSSAKFDWLTIDIEHSAINIESVQNLIAHIQGNGMYALVRVYKNDDVIIKRVLDAGADGIIVPMVNSKTDAENAVQSARYPSYGKRGVGLSRAQKYGIGFDEYKKWQEKECVIIAQIEHKDAADNIEEIISVEGIDGVIIGPYDLSGSLGIAGDFDSPILKEKINKVEQACLKHNFPLGSHVIQPKAELLNDRIEDGYTFLAFSLDFLFLGNKVREEMNKVTSQ